MREMLIAMTVAAGGTQAMAQWSNDPGSNLAVSDRGGEQVQPKIRGMADGACYIAWFDNATGGYDVYLQRLDAQGVENWSHNGRLIADRSFSSTVDYDLEVDASGSAILAFNDDRVDGDQISVVRVNPEGNEVWTTRVSSGSAFKANPKLTILSGGEIAVGWTEAGGYKIQRLSTAGAPLLASPISVVESGRSLTLCDLAPGPDGAVMVSYVRPTGSQFQSPKHLYANAFSAGGVATWAAPRAVFDGGSLQFGYFPPIVSDGSGGAVFGWYNTGGTRQALVQRLRADGTEMYAHNGVALSTDSSQIHLEPGIAFDAARDLVYGSWVVANQTQSQWGWRAQAITAAGGRLWTETGTELLPLSSMQKSFSRAVADSQGLTAACFDARSAVTGVVLAAGIDPETGAARWGQSPMELCATESGKSRLDASWAGQFSVFAWSDGPSGGGDILAQNVDPSGQLGPVPCLGDFNRDGFIDFMDYADYIGCFEDGVCPPGGSADTNGDDFIDFFDYLDFVTAFETGC